jgi:hypothetical protein
LFFFSNFKSTFGNTAYSGTPISSPYKTNNLEATDPTELRLIINATSLALTYTNASYFKSGASGSSIPALSQNPSIAVANHYIYQVYDPNFTVNYLVPAGGTTNTIKTYKNNNCDLAYIFYDIQPTVFLPSVSGGVAQTSNISRTAGSVTKYTPFSNTVYYDLNIAYGGLANCPGCLDVLTKAGNSGLYNCSIPTDFDTVGNTGFPSFSGGVGNTGNLVCKSCNTDINGATSNTANAVYINASKYNIYFYDKSGSSTTPSGLTTVTEVPTSDGTNVNTWKDAPANANYFTANPGKTAKILKFAPGSTVAMKDLYVDALSGQTGIYNGQNYYFQANYQLMPILWPPNITKVYNRFRGTFIEKIDGNQLTYRNIPSMSS